MSIIKQPHPISERRKSGVVCVIILGLPLRQLVKGTELRSVNRLNSHRPVKFLLGKTELRLQLGAAGIGADTALGVVKIDVCHSLGGKLVIVRLFGKLLYHSGLLLQFYTFCHPNPHKANG